MLSFPALPQAEGFVAHSRLDEIAEDLGIAGFQRPVWNVFVDTVEDAHRELAAIKAVSARNVAETAPGFQEALSSRSKLIAAERRRFAELVEITEILYRSLTPRQRVRADRLLRPLCSGLG